MVSLSSDYSRQRELFWTNEVCEIPQGLGKTVESIALMCANESRDPEEKSTLIVAPLALLEQWKEEIEEKTVKTKDGRK